MKKIIACTDKKEYPVLIDNFSPADIKKIIINNSASDRYFVIIDENVNRLHQNFIKRFISLLGKNTNRYILRSGERSKSFPELKKLLESILQSGLSRSSSLIAIGGGVTGDISAFAASIFMRGIKLFHIPTTLVATIDSSIGGKTGINFKNKKNIVGTFYQPECVIINLSFLKTLPKTEIESGMGEVIKYSFISDTSFFKYISDNYASILALNESVLTKVIRNCLLLKTSIVHQDEFENGLRKILNLGHTFGHAIESASKFKIKHGIAVNAGLIIMLSISKTLKILNEEKFYSFIQLPLKNLVPDTLLKIHDDDILYYLKFDKKNFGGKLNGILIKDIGEALIDVQLNRDQILEGFQYLKKCVPDLE